MQIPIGLCAYFAPKSRASERHTLEKAYHALPCLLTERTKVFISVLQGGGCGSNKQSCNGGQASRLHGGSSLRFLFLGRKWCQSGQAPLGLRRQHQAVNPAQPQTAHLVADVQWVIVTVSARVSMTLTKAHLGPSGIL